MGMYRLMCTKQWKPKSTNLVTPKNLRMWSKNRSYRWGSDRMFLRYVYHKTFMVKFPDKCKWQNKFNPDNKVGLVWYTDGYKTSKGTGTVVYRWCWRRGHNFILGLHPTKFQAEMCSVKARIMENIEKGYTGKNIYILSYSQAAIKALDSFQINSKSVWDVWELMAMK